VRVPAGPCRSTSEGEQAIRRLRAGGGGAGRSRSHSGRSPCRLRLSL